MTASRSKADVPTCPKCGTKAGEPVNEWTGGAKTKKPMTVRRYSCGSCGTGFVAWVDGKTGEMRIMTRKG